ncbi:PAS domain S-box-containing protein [Azospirillum sp. OGB3]|uniref:hybrid sensor histidine kinase/response regulator n=1 Tax=Azospirillum sp. OGB3 TaxID=2587012 RepID=UPI00179AC1D8|nr:ATP-binding protein [Azospirillum sp. OGB3]MBB3265773.1 PAS domain S-box-containing protein [Azospirillum sp. OGB3]
MERALILAPRGRDAAVASALLGEVGIAAQSCPDLTALCRALDDGVGLLILVEEAVRTADLQGLVAWIGAQPPWSDLPVVLLTMRGDGAERTPEAARLTELLGNVTFIERPFHPTTLVSVVRTCLRGRRRQYEAQAHLVERDRLLADLASERARFATLIEHLPVGVSLMDRDGRIMLCNPAFEGFVPDAVIPSRQPDEDNGWIGQDEDGRRLTRDRFPGARALRGEMVHGVEFTYQLPDGLMTWVRVSGVPVRNGMGQVVGALAVIVDIGAQKAAQEALQRLTTTLEATVQERTRELEATLERLRAEMRDRERAEEQLRQTQKLETLGQLTGGVAHDFNNLLMAVLGNLELLRKRLPDDPMTERLFDGAMQGAQRGATLTQRLLAFARRQDLQPQAVDLVGLLEGMRTLLERSVGPRVVVRIEAPTDLPPVLIDPNQLELAILNLAVNSRDAMPDGGTLTVSLDEAPVSVTSGLTSGVHPCLCVRDTGTGMDAQTLMRAIEPFFSTKGIGKGTGLGLSMVHGLAVQSGGAFQLSSVPGQGTLVELWLPKATSPVRTAELPQAPTTAASPAVVLVVDDDALIAMSTVDMLADLGHTVLEANSGSDALDLLRSGQVVDLLMTDYAMPGMTGVELAQAARSMAPNLPVLLATGYADLPEGIDADLPRLTKPYTQAQLAMATAKLLPKATATSALTKQNDGFHPASHAGRY